MAAEKIVNYEALEKERLNQNRLDLKEKMASDQELGRFGSLRRNILSLVVSEKYDQGKEELTQHVENKGQDFPNLQGRVEKFVKHAAELIQAIQTKRNFPGLASLSLSKQQELNEKVLAHFDELKQTLKSIERAEKEIKLSDLRSTAWVVNVFMHSLIIILIVGFCLAISHGLWYSASVVFDALVNDVTIKLAHLLGWL